MSYEPTNWKAGDVVTSAKLNKLEQGVANAGGGVLVVGTVPVANRIVCDKTAAEMWAAAKAGAVVIDGGTFVYLVLQSIMDEGYTFICTNDTTFSAEFDDEKPYIVL